MPTIWIYQDEGASPRCVQFLVKAFRQEGLTNLHLINRRDLQKHHWQSSVDLLVFPGGRDIPYDQALKGPVNAAIRKFVHDGGKFLGICAGGYYGSAHIEFEKGHPQEIIQSRELAFFPGIAQGPAYGCGQFCYQSERGARLARLHLASYPFSYESTFAYYNGGCAFLDADQYTGIHVIARYEDLPHAPAAMVRCQVGKGIAILSGVHPEYSGCHTSEPLNKLWQDLKTVESQRRKLFQLMLKSFSSNRDSFCAKLK